MACLGASLLVACGGRTTSDAADYDASSVTDGDGASRSDAGASDVAVSVDANDVDAPSSDDVMAPCNAMTGNVLHFEIGGTRPSWSPGTWTFTDNNAQWETHAAAQDLGVAAQLASNGVFGGLSIRRSATGSYPLPAGTAMTDLFLGISGDSCNVSSGRLTVLGIATQPATQNPDGAILISLELWFYGQCHGTVLDGPTRGCVRYQARP